nr:hypothetical protein [Candidatus Njordarchaeota archaeon]
MDKRKQITVDDLKQLARRLGVAELASQITLEVRDVAAMPEVFFGLVTLDCNKRLCPKCNVELKCHVILDKQPIVERQCEKCGGKFRYRAEIGSP